MMAEYISREAALVYAPLPKYLREYQTQNLDDAWEDGYFCALDQIRSIPAADVRPVVLCRDCMLRQYCKVAQYLGGDGFCSNGVKREES